jgi:argininosuccinate lyase
MSKEIDTSKLWGGRFNEATDAFVQRFTASVRFDQRMAMQDIAGSLAHARMLHAVGVLNTTELQEIEDGLQQVQQEIAGGRFQWSVELEDVHMNIEARLTELIGITGKKLHTGRSRNDQVATDIRLYLRSAIDSIAAELTRLQHGTVALAAANTEIIMPGFTHLQTAQPVVFGHHLLAWNEMLERDYGRLMDCRARLNQSPLGARRSPARRIRLIERTRRMLLGFDKPTENSLDSVSDRDFAIEFCAFAALLMTHLSRMSEELVLWTSSQFNFIELPDRFCTGSSIMPQKKNPDVPELVRGKVGRVNGHLIALLTLMKSQPLAYNKDNQEDKEPLFDSVDTVLRLPARIRRHDPGDTAQCAGHARSGAARFSTATDLADYLVRKGVPFAMRMKLSARRCAHGIAHGQDLAEMELATLQEFCAAIRDDVFDVLSLEGSVAARNHLGGTAPRQVAAAAQRAQDKLAARQKP